MKNKDELKDVFDEYVSKYDKNSNKIALKYSHTFRVADLCEKLAITLGLSKKEVYIAYVIGMLHDIGRFEQIKRYNTFSDRHSIDHASLGVEILKGGMLRKFLPDIFDYDDIIINSVEYHNKIRIPDENYTEKELTFFKLIRDADKIDIYYIMQNGSDVILYGDFDIEKLNNNVKNSIYSKTLVDRKYMINDSDQIIVNIIYVFDIYFKCSFEYLKQNQYISKYISMINSSNQESKEFLKEVNNLINNYIDEKISILKR